MAINKAYKDSIIIAKLFKESIAFAFGQLKGDKFRTFLSLFGVTIGVFSIVAILSAIDALQNNVKQSFESIGSNVVQIGKWPMVGEDENGNIGTQVEYKWWEYMKRPEISLEDFKYLKENSKSSDAIAMFVSFNSKLKHNRNSINRANVLAVTENWESIVKIDLEYGRSFNKREFEGGFPVSIIGHELAKELFGEENALDKYIKVRGNNTRVIGVTKKKGENLIDIFPVDDMLVVPLNYSKSMINLRNISKQIFISPKTTVSQSEFDSEIIQLMRAQRRLSPNEKNNFSLSKISFLVNTVQSVFTILNLVGWVIAGFSLLIGGFGIANIMFVSVKERTNIIGIQKALGAKKYVIITQFLVEAVALSIAGGIIGILLVSGIILLIPTTNGISLSLSLANIISGVSVASLIGIIAGIVPAWLAANLNPVDAINSK